MCCTLPDSISCHNHDWWNIRSPTPRKTKTTFRQMPCWTYCCTQQGNGGIAGLIWMWCSKQLVIRALYITRVLPLSSGYGAVRSGAARSFWQWDWGNHNHSHQNQTSHAAWWLNGFAAGRVACSVRAICSFYTCMLAEANSTQATYTYVQVVPKAIFPEIPVLLRLQLANNRISALPEDIGCLKWVTSTIIHIITM